MRMIPTATLLVAALAGTQATQAQSSGELLQKGIYTQETVGDLEGAIKIYRQILNTAGESRAVNAQAQYRLGLCLLGKGDSAGATQAFRKLIREYPEQRELVAKARQQVPRLSLLPVPWSDREYAEYRRLVNGNEVPGRVAFSVEPSSTANRILLASRNTDALNWYRAEVDRETLAPFSTWEKNDSSVVETEFQDGVAHVTMVGKPSRNLPVESGIFDDYEYPFVLRRLPLEQNYQTSFPILADGLMIPTAAKVEGLEDIEVPAGKFHCFRVAVDKSAWGRETFWYPTDPSHTLVKYSIGTLDVELTRVTPAGPEPTTYLGEDGGVSFVAPAGWVVGKPEPADGGTIVRLSDPEGQAISAFVFYRHKNQPARAQIDARQEAETVAEKEKRMVRNGKENYKYRQNSYQRWQLKGYAASRFIADYTNAEKQPKAELGFVVSTESTLVNIWGEGIDPANLDSFAERFQSIVDSLVVP